MKVNNEEIIGMYVALEKFVSLDHEAEMKKWADQIDVIESAAKKVKGVGNRPS